MKTTLFIFSTLVFIYPAVSNAQATGVPFLLISSSPQANGMGGTAASVATDDALATLSNPGQLGLFTLNGLFNAETFAPTTQWLPQFQLKGLTYSSQALNAGMNLGTLLQLPFSMSAGIGYSKIDLELGEFTITDESGPEPIGQYQGSEKSDNVSASLGFEYLVRVGCGWNFKSIHSNLGFSAGVNATDFGLLVDVPVVKIVSTIADEEFEIAPKIRPMLDLTFSDTRANVGGGVKYADTQMSDPLPRSAVIGGNIEAGLLFRIGSADRKLISFTLVRQADDILVTRYPNGDFAYQNGIGDISFGNDVILGKTNINVTIRKGWQIQAGEALYIRGGSVDGPGLSYTTMGFSVCLGGIMRLVEFANPGASVPWLEYAVDHFDLQYHYSSYSSLESPVDATTEGSINLVVRSIPF